MHGYGAKMTITDEVFHYKAKWLRLLARKMREIGQKGRQKGAEVTVCGGFLPLEVRNALLRQGFTLKNEGIGPNLNGKLRILKGEREYAAVNEGRFWWARPLEGEIAEGERLYPSALTRC